MTKSPQIVQLAHKANSLHSSLTLLKQLPDFANGNCTQPGVDPDYWFGETSIAIAQAKTACSGCPAFDLCLVYAMHDTEVVGIWAGTDSDDRARLRTSIGDAVTQEQLTEGLAILTKVASQLATEYGVKERTVLRWKADLRQQEIFASQVELAA